MIAATSLTLTACQQGSSPEPGPEMGNAVAQPSPAATGADGRVIELPAATAEISDMEVSGDVLGLRSETTLTIGTVGEIESGDATELSVDAACGDLTVTGTTFVLPCGDEVRLIDAANPADEEIRDVSDAAPATVAALLSTGELIVGNDREAEVTVYRDGEDPETIAVAAPTTQMIAVQVAGSPDSVIRTYNPDTTIQDIDWTNDRQGGTLRLGIGLGQMSGGPDGLVLASDNSGSQLTVYTADDVIRLHQTAPVDESPWGVAWDETNRWAWIASTAENSLAAYDISTGVPLEEHRLSSVADAHNIVFLSDGTLVAASATGDGLQVIDNPAAVG
ncbi:hypothetical protein A605_07440 [Corynebacterium halotolerans YIM 70093 = DSM 44683]|uniref:Prolipoprotein LppL n=1 Tax=Corynebacterium halotolerans YIM 70093 = DSM 44683 TaxID=1121362 RepID=M1NYD2_9CORY|nr:hypothetical protein A605_07440 [Corynebacterium halotolerans YIM 70093 = DSM 44683]